MTLQSKEQFKKDLMEVTDPEEFIKVVSEFYGLSVEAVVGRARNREIVDVRTVIVKSFIDRWSLTSNFIGKLLNRDHTTILNLYRRPVKKLWKVPEQPLDGIIDLGGPAQNGQNHSQDVHSKPTDSSTDKA